MVEKTYSMGLYGLEAFPVEVEADLSQGLPHRVGRAGSRGPQAQHRRPVGAGRGAGDGPRLHPRKRAL